VKRVPVWFGIVLLACLGCGKTIDVLTRPDPNYDFTPHRTYGWDPKKVEELIPKDVVDPADLDTRIRQAVDHTLQKKGFQLSNSPALVVGYSLQVSDRVMSETSPPPGMGDWQPRSDPTRYSVGALVVDVNDGATQNRVWRGAAFTDVQARENRDRVPDIVDKLLEDFPPKK
jgi:hypothetical protein